MKILLLLRRYVATDYEVESTWTYWKLLRWEELLDNDIYSGEISSGNRRWIFCATDGKSLLVVQGS
jgi:hypothetical protein